MLCGQYGERHPQGPEGFGRPLQPRRVSTMTSLRIPVAGSKVSDHRNKIIKQQQEHTHTYTHTHSHTHTCKQTHIHFHTSTHTHTQTYTHTNIHTQTNTHTHTHTQTHTSVHSLRTGINRLFLMRIMCIFWQLPLALLIIAKLKLLAYNFALFGPPSPRGCGRQESCDSSFYARATSNCTVCSEHNSQAINLERERDIREAEMKHAVRVRQQTRGQTESYTTGIWNYTRGKEKNQMGGGGRGRGGEEGETTTRAKVTRKAVLIMLSLLSLLFFFGAYRTGSGYTHKKLIKSSTCPFVVGLSRANVPFFFVTDINIL